MKESGGNLSCFLNLDVRPFGLGGPLRTLRSGCKGYGACLVVQCAWRSGAPGNKKLARWRACLLIEVVCQSPLMRLTVGV